MNGDFRRTATVLVLGSLLTFAVSGCCHWCRSKPPQSGEGTGAVPIEKTPLDAIEVEDAIETALLEQELGLRPVTTVGRKVYFRGDQALKDRLTGLGYAVTQEDANEVLQRVMRVEEPREDPKAAEALFQELGLRILLRQEKGWIVQGKLARLSALSRVGYKLSDLGKLEPHPRSVRIVLDSPQQVPEVARLGVDIFSAGYAPQEPEQPSSEQARRFVVDGGAFDYAIDALRQRGFAVEIREVELTEVQP